MTTPNIQNSQSTSFTWPPIYIPLLFAGVMSVTALFLYNIYPIILGWLAAVSLGIDRFIEMFVSYPWVYAVAQNILLGIYVFTTMAVLTFEFFILVYLLFDKTLLHQENNRMIIRTARKALLPAMALQLLVGFVGCMILWFFPWFDALWWLPSFWTASVLRALYTALWEFVLILFAFSFMFSHHWKKSLVDCLDLFRTYKIFFILWFLILFVVTWCPAWSLQRMGITSSVLYVVGGVFLQTFVLTLGLIIFFQQSGEFNA